jgi:hypothetical protein
MSFKINSLTQSYSDYQNPLRFQILEGNFKKDDDKYRGQKMHFRFRI